MAVIGDRLHAPIGELPDRRVAGVAQIPRPAARPEAHDPQPDRPVPLGSTALPASG